MLKQLIKILLLISTGAYGVTPQKFCEKIQSLRGSNGKETQLTFSRSFQAALLPSTAFKMNYAGSLDSRIEVTKKVKNSHVFINVTKGSDSRLIKNLRTHVKNFKKSRKAFIKNEFYLRLYQITTFDECVKTVEENPRLFSILKRQYSEVMSLLPYQELKQRLDVQKWVLRQTKVLRSLGWTIHRDFSLERLMEILSTQPENIVLITHANKNGAIFDVYNNTLPSTIFENISYSLKKIVILSCYGDSVKKLFRINELVKKRSVVYGYLKNKASFEKYFESTIPILGVKVLTKSLKRNKQLSSNSRLLKMCNIQLDSVPSRKLALYLNNKFVSVLNNSHISFYCDMSSKKNTLTIRRISSRKGEELLSSETLPAHALLEVTGHIEKKEFKHFFSKGKYLSSKSINYFTN